jgi:acyl-CoA thioester hydrolase
MPDVYEHLHVVGDDEIDDLGHANNVVYVEWMQSAAIAHTTAQGWPGGLYKELGAGWVVRSHAIHYHQPARRGDQIVVRTWVATMRKVTSLRRYEIYRTADRRLLATAETKWAFVDYATGQPARIPPEIARSFTVIADAASEDGS